VQGALLEFGGFEAPGGESVAAFGQRVVGFLRGLPGGEHALFTHGGVIRVLLREAGRDPRVAPGEFLRLRLNGRGERRFVLIEERLP
jgi:probable phosphoglycerate mutase